MLIEFSVSNFRSFRERQTLSMVAASKLRKRENTFKPELTGEAFPDLLKVCVIYGPNASGKSNLLRGLETVSRIALREPSATSPPLPIAPFRFDPLLLDQPSVFDIHFIYEKVRYQFELAATSERIVSERLTWFPRGREALLYVRQHTDSGDQYDFGPQLEGGNALHEAWTKLTPPRLLFLSQAVSSSSEDLTQLRKPFEWLSNAISTLLDGASVYSNYTLDLASKFEPFAGELADFLRDVDIPVSRITVRPVSQLEKLASIAASSEDATREARRNATKRTLLTHQSALGTADLGYDDESEGTKSLIGFWLPWSSRHPEKGKPFFVLAVDELDSSLHPKIVEALVARHQSAEVPSQLIFTTHDTHLMDAKLLRRDQFWITERDGNGATTLRSIHDFEGRESEDIEKRYFEGRYRGLPILGST